MYPQSHTIINGLDQMLHHHHHFPSNNSHHHIPMERSTSSWKPSIEVAPNCPRCASTNTKFCYYNNYSLSQPRYFCKGCRRYWTKGGSLRNVPVGGGCRKNRRGKSSKNHQNDRVSINTSVSEDRESSIGENRQSNGSRDIDMALVFAKFLNQKPNTGEEFENGSSSCNNYLTPQESVETENHNDNNNSNDKGLLSDSDPNSLLTIENFGIEELEGFLWSDDAATMSSSVTWQQPPLMQMQLQELEYSVPLNENDQLLPISSESDMNSISDGWSNWSSFDLSTMQVFSSTL